MTRNKYFMKKVLAIVSTLLLFATSSALSKETSMLKVGSAAIYYETAGSGEPIVFIHAGVADSRQWSNEFSHFSKRFNVIRYDMRGFGQSEPADGEFTHLGDLVALLEHLSIDQPVILVGCSMGGSTALDYALEELDKVRALILVDSAPSGLQIDLPSPAKFALVEEADEAGNLELVAELETQIWFDGDRKTSSVNQQMRQLAYAMNLAALHHEAKALGTRHPNSETPAIDELGKLQIPVLAIVGENDIPYMHAAAEILATKISNFRKVTIENAAHHVFHTLTGMYHPSILR
jgi:2-hydroxy-6-oxonona-2,4-dienedioate hydrolase